MTTVRRSEQGFALFGVLLLGMLTLTLGASAMLYSAIELKTTQNYKHGMMAFATAESGATHALNAINRRMVQDFKGDIVDQWTAHEFLMVLGENTVPVESSTSMSYGARTRAQHLNTRDGGFIFSRGFAPDGSVRTVTLRVVRSPIPQGIGAIFAMDDDFANSEFINNGNPNVDGNNHTLATTVSNGQAGGMCAGPAPGMVPAINTQNAESMAPVLAGTAGVEENYIGLGSECTGVPGEVGYDCTRAGVLPMGGPLPEDIDAIIANMRDNIPDCEPADIVDCPDTTDEQTGIVHNCRQSSGDCYWAPTCASMELNSQCNGNPLHVDLGTYDNPGFIHFPATVAGGEPMVSELNGNFSGYGVLIVDGDLTINGTVDFGGLIIVRGTLTISGNANVAGSIWAAGNSITVGGDSNICYSSEALAVADSVGVPVNGGPPRNLPTTMTVAAWVEGLPAASEAEGGLPSF